MDVDDEILSEFLAESHENIDRMGDELVALEADSSAVDVLASVFRTVHTVKGTCGFLGFSRLEHVAHAGEHLLGKLRDGDLAVSPTIISSLLELVDAIRATLAAIAATGDDTLDHAALIEKLAELGGIGREQIESHLPVGEILVEMGAAAGDDVALALASQGLGDARPIGEILVGTHAADPDDVAEALRRQQGAARRGEGTLRIDVALLDRLMDLVSELVLVRNQILQIARVSTSTLSNPAQRLNQITTELQEDVMRTRLQPIGRAWAAFPRLLRDLGVECGKSVRIEMLGAETELDRAVIEAIRDPLTHIVRNAVDHGIERPEVRVAAGKPREGRLVLRACHLAGQVLVELVDDGAGLDTDRIRQHVVRRGLASETQAAAMTDRDLHAFLFLPGFSTADEVTKVSGRGVGMDVVKNNVEKAGGSIDLASERGVGTTVSIRLPLTLAIVPALIVRAGNERYAVPLSHLVELTRLRVEGAGMCLELFGETAVGRLRGSLIPLVDLDATLHRTAGRWPAAAEQGRTIAVLEADGKIFGLAVDQVYDGEEIVVKPLSEQLDHLGAYAGTTIMGDGGVALILDIAGLARMVGVVGDGDRANRVLQRELEAIGDNGETHIVLLAEIGGEQLAVLPELVVRLETLDARDIESIDGRPVMRYGAEVIDVLMLRPPAGERLPVVICRMPDADKPIAVVVDRILTIIEMAGLPTDGDVSIIEGRATQVVGANHLTALRANAKVRA